MSTLLVAFLLFVTLIAGQAGPARSENRGQQGQNQPAQEGQTSECDDTIYPVRELTTRARILAKPNPRYPREARPYKVTGRVVLSLVLCKSGSITDIEVVEGLPHGLSEEAIKAARLIKFEPAQKDGQPVSMRIRVAYNFETF